MKRFVDFTDNLVGVLVGIIVLLGVLNLFLESTIISRLISFLASAPLSYATYILVIQDLLYEGRCVVYSNITSQKVIMILFAIMGYSLLVVGIVDFVLSLIKTFLI